MSMHRVIDFQDDLGAAFTVADVAPPETLKTASFREDYELTDGDYALILVDEDGREHRKFACHDPGNTWMSLWYFENVDSGLPDYAKQAAAENLAMYAGVHEIDLEEMFPQTAAMCEESGVNPYRKRTWSGDGGTHQKVGSAPPGYKEPVPVDSLSAGAHYAIYERVGAMYDRNPTAAARRHHDALIPRVLENLARAKSDPKFRDQMHSEYKAYHAARGAPVSKEGSAVKEAVTAIEYGLIAALVAVGLIKVGEVLTDAVKQRIAASPKAREQFSPQKLPPRLQQGALKHNTSGQQTRMAVASALYKAVQAGDITEQDFVRELKLAPTVIGNKIEKQANMGEMASSPFRIDERRVLVKEAHCAPVEKFASAEEQEVSPFDKVAEASRRWVDLEPWDRRVLGLTFAQELPDFVEVPAKIAAYMGTEVNPSIETHMKWRMSKVARSDDAKEDYERVGLMAKVGSLDLEDAVEALHLLDEQNGMVIPRDYGPGMPDPYLCVYGGPTKEAMWAWTRGDVYINEHQLSHYVASSLAKVQFGELLTDEMLVKLRKDPVRTFEGLPTAQKQLIARMASNPPSPGRGGAYSA